MPDILCQVRGPLLGLFLLLYSLGAAMPAAGESQAAETTRVPGPPLTLQEALARALKHHPELAAYSEEVRAREAEALQAGLRPNPVLSLEAENVLGSGDFSGTGAAETMVMLHQTIELGEKRSRRRELAESETTLAGSDYKLARREVLAGTLNAFHALLAAQDRLELAKERTTLARKFLETVEERIASGKSAATERIRALIQWKEEEVALEKARRDLAVVRSSLAVMMGLEADEFGAAAGELALLPELPESSGMEDLLSGSPGISRQIAETESRRRAVALERAERWPDLEVGLGARYFRESEDTALVLGASIPLPLFDRNQGGVAAARSRLARARAEERSHLLQTRAALAGVREEMAVARKEAEVLEREVLPAARQALEAAEYGYRVGKFGILDVLDARRTLAQVQEDYLESLLACHRAFTEWNRLAGRELPGTAEPETAYAAPKE